MSLIHYKFLKDDTLLPVGFTDCGVVEKGASRYSIFCCIFSPTGGSVGAVANWHAGLEQALRASKLISNKVATFLQGIVSLQGYLFARFATRQGCV